MIDKTVLNYTVTMRTGGSLTIPEAILPEGFHFRQFSGRDAGVWAGLHTAAGHFDCFEDAMALYERDFQAYPAEMEQRCLFVENGEGEAAGTIMAWFGELDSVPMQRIHWVSVQPRFQRRGIARAMLQKAMQLCREFGPGQEIYLVSHTCSWPAIGLYLKAGFLPYSAKETKDVDEKAWPIIFDKLELANQAPFLSAGSGR